MYGVVKTNYGVLNPGFIERVSEKMAQVFNFSPPFNNNGEVVYSSKLDGKYTGSNILILGGGGSTSRWLQDANCLKSVKCYDYVWAVNSFYKHPIINESVKVDLFSVGPEVDLCDGELIKYLYKHGTTAAFELHDKWTRTTPDPDFGKPPELFAEELNRFYPSEDKVAFATKFYSQLGGGARLILLAEALGVSTVDFIGFDGPDAIAKKDHAFVPGKGNFSRAVSGMSPDAKRAFFQEQYDFFWKYAKSINSGTKFKSLDDTNVLHTELKWT